MIIRGEGIFIRLVQKVLQRPSSGPDFYMASKIEFTFRGVGGFSPWPAFYPDSIDCQIVHTRRN
ncbi:MAG: hypothetical protein A2Y79_04745 [Deltaproteobacteria bacterium RBG_13_43_22]|nr:MAG: hypothetical protein A2Y79_04745 [Deltaproteobacteria bacterium RBG_13_43_22]